LPLPLRAEEGFPPATNPCSQVTFDGVAHYSNRSQYRHPIRRRPLLRG